MLKPSFKSHKGRELNPKFFDAEEHEAFLEADAKQWQQHLDLGAAEVIPPEKTDYAPKEKILPIASRSVRTNKNKDAKIKKLIAASRLVIPGHLQNTPSQPVESKTRTHHGRVGSGGAQRGGWARRARQNGTPTGLSAQDTTVTRVPQGIENNCPEHLFRSTNKRNPM